MASMDRRLSAEQAAIEKDAELSEGQLEHAETETPEQRAAVERKKEIEK